MYLTHYRNSKGIFVNLSVKTKDPPLNLAIKKHKKELKNEVLLLNQDIINDSFYAKVKRKYSLYLDTRKKDKGKQNKKNTVKKFINFNPSLGQMKASIKAKTIDLHEKLLITGQDESSISIIKSTEKTIEKNASLPLFNHKGVIKNKIMENDQSTITNNSISQHIESKQINNTNSTQSYKKIAPIINIKKNNSFIRLQKVSSSRAIRQQNINQTPFKSNYSTISKNLIGSSISIEKSLCKIKSSIHRNKRPLQPIHYSTQPFEVNHDQFYDNIERRNNYHKNILFFSKLNETVALKEKQFLRKKLNMNNEFTKEKYWRIKVYHKPKQEQMPELY